MMLAMAVLAGCGGGSNSAPTANDTAPPPPNGSPPPTPTNPPPPATSGSATVVWSPPTTNSDGSTLANLAGFRIYYGTSATSLTQTLDVPGVGLTSFVVPDLAAGTWYFAVKAYTSTGDESGLSNVASKTIG